MKLLICTQAVDKNHPILGFFHGWILEFSKHFSEVHVICLQKGEHTLPPHVYVYSLGKEEGESKLKYVYRFYKHFGNIFFNVRVDFVFFHMGAIYNILGAPFFLIRSFYNTEFYWWKAHGHINLFGRIALLFVDKVYTSTESGFPILTKKRNVVGQAIDVSHFILPEDETVRKREIVFVGRIMPVKHIEDFIDTANILTSLNLDLMFTIVGPVGDVVYAHTLKDRCISLSLQDRIQFVGSKTQAELVSIYQSATIFLNTSLTHSMDKTVLEGMLCGTIPVTGNKAFSDLLSLHALYIKSATPRIYAERIQQLLESDTDALRISLRDSVIAFHSLGTLSARIFNV